jgi:hypothetical protein
VDELAIIRLRAMIQKRNLCGFRGGEKQNRTS